MLTRIQKEQYITKRLKDMNIKKESFPKYQFEFKEIVHLFGEISERDTELFENLVVDPSITWYEYSTYARRNSRIKNPYKRTVFYYFKM